MTRRSQKTKKTKKNGNSSGEGKNGKGGGKKRHLKPGQIVSKGKIKYATHENKYSADGGKSGKGSVRARPNPDAGYAPDVGTDYGRQDQLKREFQEQYPLSSSQGMWGSAGGSSSRRSNFFGFWNQTDQGIEDGEENNIYSLDSSIKDMPWNDYSEVIL
jgi:hypothetical protein